VERIVFADVWQSLFAEFGLVSFDDFLDYFRDGRISKNDKR